VRSPGRCHRHAAPRPEARNVGFPSQPRCYGARGKCRSRALPPYVVLVAHRSAASMSLRTRTTHANDAVADLQTIVPAAKDCVSCWEPARSRGMRKADTPCAHLPEMAWDSLGCHRRVDGFHARRSSPLRSEFEKLTRKDLTVATPKGTYVQVGGWNVWWSQKRPDRIALGLDKADPDLTKKPQIFVKQGTTAFEQFAAVLRKYDKPAPPAMDAAADSQPASP
jgi:hypothetical protein